MSQTSVVYAYNPFPGLKIRRRFDWLFHGVASTQQMFRNLQKYESPLARVSLFYQKGRRLKQAWITQIFLKHQLPHLLFNHQKRLKKQLRMTLEMNFIAS
jgi:hypothetical protein